LQKSFDSLRQGIFVIRWSRRRHQRANAYQAQCKKNLDSISVTHWRSPLTARPDVILSLAKVLGQGHRSAQERIWLDAKRLLKDNGGRYFIAAYLLLHRGRAGREGWNRRRWQPNFLKGFGLPVSWFLEYQHTW
jgi:hypothetical protein